MDSSAASGQSTDSNDPTPLVGNLIQGDAEPNGQSYYYSFTAGPGDIMVTIDGSTDYHSTNAHLIFSDAQAREVANVGVPATTSGLRKT